MVRPNHIQGSLSCLKLWVLRIGVDKVLVQPDALALCVKMGFLWLHVTGPWWSLCHNRKYKIDTSLADTKLGDLLFLHFLEPGTNQVWGLLYTLLSYTSIHTQATACGGLQHVAAQPQWSVPTGSRCAFILRIRQCQ
jgi:hypothetical protein